MYAKRYDSTEYMEITRSYIKYCKDRSFDPISAAVAWVEAHSRVTAPIVGRRSLEFDMTPELRKEITALTPYMPNATDRRDEVLWGSIYSPTFSKGT